MRRFLTIPVVMAAVVLGAVPALMAGAQLIDSRVSEQLVTADQLVTDRLVTDQLVTADQLVTGVQPTTDVTGMLIDGACYLSRGAKATADHTACAIACAQKGHRLALLSPGGGIYMVIGALAQDNNAKLISLINKAVVLTGTVGTRVMDVMDSVDTAKTTVDRRLATNQTEVVEKVVRRGDVREGDLISGSELTIDAISARLAAPPGK
jgi:hypothetical protein